MRAPLRLCALAVALAIAAVALVPPARADMDKPSWNPGDYWAYSSTDVGFGYTGSGTVRYDIVGPDTVNVGGTDYAVYRARVTVTGTTSIYSNATFSSADTWFRTSDLATVKQTWNLTANFGIFGRLSVVETTTYNPPLGLVWPFRNAGTWTSTGTSTTVTTIGGGLRGTRTATTTNNYVVDPSSPVSVTAGTFDTTPVKATDQVSQRYVITYWSPQVGNAAREVSYDSSGDQVSVRELTAYSYSGSGFLGLPIVVWLVIILVVFLAVLGVVYMSRKRRRRGVMTPQSPPPQMPP